MPPAGPNRRKFGSSACRAHALSSNGTHQSFLALPDQRAGFVLMSEYVEFSRLYRRQDFCCNVGGLHGVVDTPAVHRDVVAVPAEGIGPGYIGKDSGFDLSRTQH